MRTEESLLTVAEYFAGIGLVKMGLETAGWKVVFANDYSRKKEEMYRDFFPNDEAPYIAEDIFHLAPESIPPVALGTCSFPCIDLSLAGNMNGIVVGNHSSAFWGFIRILKEQGDFAPPIILVENVPGWLNSNQGEDFKTAVKALNNLGYACDVFVLNALSFTPQSRMRVFLVGARSQNSNGALDRILLRPEFLLPDRLKNYILSDESLLWFYNEIPLPPPLRKHGMSEIVETLEDSDARWWSEEEVRRHMDMMSKAHLNKVLWLAERPEISYRTFFRRRRKGQTRAEVRSDDLSGCLRTAVGGSGKQFLIRAGRGTIKMRTMTPREYARLQGVPDKYEIRVNEIQALTGFGDAVCVPAISWIAENVLNPLAKTLNISKARRKNA